MRSHMESRWAMERAGRLETQCALERPPLQRAAPAAEAAEPQMWLIYNAVRTHLVPDRRGGAHRVAPAAEAAGRPNRDCSLSRKTKLLQLLLSKHLAEFGVTGFGAVAWGDRKANERV